MILFRWTGCQEGAARSFLQDQRGRIFLPSPYSTLPRISHLLDVNVRIWGANIDGTHMLWVTPLRICSPSSTFRLNQSLLPQKQVFARGSAAVTFANPPDSTMSSRDLSGHTTTHSSDPGTLLLTSLAKAEGEHAKLSPTLCHITDVSGDTGAGDTGCV